MKKANKINPEEYDDGMLPEYDFRGKKGIRGKYYRDLQKGYTVRIHKVSKKSAKRVAAKK